MTKIQYFSYMYEKLKLALSTLNEWKTMFAPIYFYMETCFYMFEPKHDIVQHLMYKICHRKM